MRAEKVKTGIICAISEEAAPYMGAISRVKKTDTAMLTVHEGIINQAAVALAVSGVCKVNAAVAAQILIFKHEVKRLIISGTAGGIDERLSVGNTVVSAEAAYHDVKGNYLTRYQPYMDTPFFKADEGLLALCKAVNAAEPTIYYGLMLTGEQFITHKGRDISLKKHAALSVDMETAAIAHVCYQYGVPFIAVRTVTDTKSDPGRFYENVKPASIRSFEVVNKILGEL